MLRRRKQSQHVTAAIRSLEAVLPPSGEIHDLLERVSEHRGRPMTLLKVPLDRTVSGALISTATADYIAVSQDTSPERECAIVCHEVAHALLGHDHQQSLSGSLTQTGLLNGIDQSLAESVVAGRQAYAHTTEADAETVATYLAVELRRRIMRGGFSHFDDRWR